VTVVQRAKPELGYLTSLAVGDDLIVAAGGTTNQAPTVLASSNARHFEARTTPRQLGLRDIVIDGEALWTCGEYGQLAVSRDRGESWRLIDTSTDACLFGLVVADDGTLWVCGNAGYFARVRDDRLERIDLGTQARLTALYCVRDEIIALGVDGVIYRWRDGSVIRVATGATQPLTALAITKNRTWLVTGDGGFIARSPDGQWFSRAKSGVEVDLEAIAALDGDVVIVGDRGLILQSRDDGRTWQPIDTDDPAHLWSIEPFGSGALIGGDNGLVLRLGSRDDRTWQDRVNVFGGARPLDAVFARGPDGFVEGAAMYSELYGVALPPLPNREQTHFVVDATPPEGFEARIVRDQQDDLSTALTDAFCGTCRIGARENGDSYHLELYEWDGSRQVLHFDHEAHAFTGVVADSLDSLAYQAALEHAHDHHELSDQAYEAGLRHLQGRVAPTLDAKRRDTEFFFYRSRWITAVLDNTELADIPTLFMADFNQIVPAEQLPARFEACEKIIPTALYSMWRAYLFDEPELRRYLELGRRHKAGLVRDAAALIDALLDGRNVLGTISDVRVRLAAFRELDLDPRRAGKAEARVVRDEARRDAALAELESGSTQDLAWHWLADGVAHRALLAKLDGRSELTMLEELPMLADDERALVIARLAESLSPELEAVLVGSLVRNDDLAGALPKPQPGPNASQVRAALALIERALRLAPDDDDTLFTHAILLLDADRAGLPGAFGELLASLPRHSPHNRLNITLRIEGPRFADAVDAILDDLPDDLPDDEELLGELADAVILRAPHLVGRLIAELPNSVNLLSTVAYKAIEAERTDAALALYDRLLDLPIPDDDSVERTNYLRAINNACIKAHEVKAHDLAVRIADRAQPYAHENPHIYHSAACAYAAVGNLNKALDQVKLAIEHDYEHLDKVEVDVDLGALRESPAFQAVFRDWRARKEGN
jgi:tetratricopeptide (TPR) repeat protein